MSENCKGIKEINLDVFQNQINLIAKKSSLHKYLIEYSSLEDVLFEELQQAVSIECFATFIRFEYERDFDFQEDLQAKQDEIYKRYIAQGGLKESFENEKERYFSKGQKYIKKKDNLDRIELTPTYILLDKIDRDMISYRLKPNYPVEVAKSVFRNLKSINLLLQDDTVDALIEDESSSFGDRDSSRMEMWNNSKRIFNNALTKYIKEFDDPHISMPKSQVSVINQRDFYNYLLWEPTEELLKFLEDRFNGSKPKDAVLLLRAMALPKVAMISIPSSRSSLIDALRKEFKIDVSSDRNESFNKHFREDSSQYMKEVDDLAETILKLFGI